MFRRTLLVCVIIGAQSFPAPYLTPCNSWDSVCQTRNLNTIYKLSVQGVPELNIKNLDPMYQKKIEENSLFITYKLYNSTIRGFGSCDVVDSKLILENSTLSFDMFCPHIYMCGLYEAYGLIIVMPIAGNGDYNVKFKDYRIHINTDIKINRNKDGKELLSFKSFKVSTELQGGMNAYLGNLFNGQNKELAENLLQFINKNANDVAHLLDGPLFYATVKKILKNINKYLKNVSLDRLVQQ